VRALSLASEAPPALLWAQAVSALRDAEVALAKAAAALSAASCAEIEAWKRLQISNEGR